MIQNLFSKTTFTMALAIAFLSPSAQATENLKKVDNEKVCMVTDMYFGKKQIPVEYKEKTYYGCCANCKETLSKDAQARRAVDPVSKKSVDKATAYIVAREDNSVLYFESENTFKQYSKQASASQTTDDSKHQGH